MHFKTVNKVVHSTSVCSLSLVSAHGDTGLVKEAFIEEYHPTFNCSKGLIFLPRYDIDSAEMLKQQMRYEYDVKDIEKKKIS